MKGGSAVLDAEDAAAWRSALSVFPRVDVCQLPEYHAAYRTRSPDSRALLWTYGDGGQRFAYPFLLTPAGWKDSGGAWRNTGYADISSIYGYSGPLSTTGDPAFLEAAWAGFDDWALEARVIAEFIRFSPHARTSDFVHRESAVEANRDIAVSDLPESEAALMEALDSKTRNMIRKAERSGLQARELEPRVWIPAFRSLYDETMNRNASPDFFFYDDAYWNRLLALPDGELRIFGVFHGGDLISAAVALAHRDGALYHLGASRGEFSNLGANNLCLFHMGRCLLERGVAFLNLGGGRTTAPDDPLLRFKKSNATGTVKYRIGKRILDPGAYRAVADRWSGDFRAAAAPARLIFYR